MTKKGDKMTTMERVEAGYNAAALTIVGGVIGHGASLLTGGSARELFQAARDGIHTDTTAEMADNPNFYP